MSIYGPPSPSHNWQQSPQIGKHVLKLANIFSTVGISLKFDGITLMLGGLYTLGFLINEGCQISVEGDNIPKINKRRVPNYRRGRYFTNPGPRGEVKRIDNLIISFSSQIWIDHLYVKINVTFEVFL